MSAKKQAIEMINLLIRMNEDHMNDDDLDLKDEIDKLECDLMSFCHDNGLNDLYDTWVNRVNPY